jgi:hypothetical protein
MVESDFLKLASSIVASSLLALWSVMSLVGEETRVGAEVRPYVAETVKVGNRRVCM